MSQKYKICNGEINTNGMCTKCYARAESSSAYCQKLIEIIPHAEVANIHIINYLMDRQFQVLSKNYCSLNLNGNTRFLTHKDLIEFIKTESDEINEQYSDCNHVVGANDESGRCLNCGKTVFQNKVK